MGSNQHSLGNAGFVFLFFASASWKKKTFDNAEVKDSLYKYICPSRAWAEISPNLEVHI